MRVGLCFFRRSAAGVSGTDCFVMQIKLGHLLADQLSGAMEDFQGAIIDYYFGPRDNHSLFFNAISFYGPSVFK